jgi:hypothetical protein
VIVFTKAALALCLVPSVLAASHVSAPVAARSASVTVHRASLSARQQAAANARATERKLLLYAPRSKVLRRFVDRATGLVKRNVAANCTRLRGHHPRYRHRHFFCRVWMQPRSSLTGVAVICFTKHHAFRVTKYHHRRRRT